MNVLRPFKGDGIIDFPADYVMIDLETTGFSTRYDCIIELAAIRVRNNEIVDTFQSLVKSDSFIFVPELVTQISGITTEMVENAPLLSEKICEFIDFVGSDIVIGHNVNFDINFVYDASCIYISKPFKNNFVDTLRISRKILPELSHHRLDDIAFYYDLGIRKEHRSLSDCSLTKDCYDNLRLDMHKKYNSVDDFQKSFKRRKYNYGLRAKDINPNSVDYDETNPLYQKVCVFTGKLEKFTRKEAMQIVANIGGINADRVTKDTNFLVLGCNDYCKSIKDGKSSKHKTAEKYQLQGLDICVMPEDAFYEMIGIVDDK